MIRAALTDGRFLFGIDAENVRRLKSGLPIILDLGPLGGKDTVLLMYGETMADILAEMRAANGGPLPVPQPFHDPKEPQ